MTHELNVETVITVLLFFFTYFIWLARKTIKNSIDLFDFAVLSTVGILPAALVLLPKQSHSLSRFLGVEFPFVILFGFLFFIVFAYLAYLTSRIHKLRRSEALLIQEVSILKEECSRTKV